MRLATVTPASTEELRGAVLEDLEALAPGMRAVATTIPIADRGAIDLLASDERGRLALVSFCMEADPESIARAVGQWEWTAANLGLLRALVSVIGLDLSQEPRLLLVAGTVSERARRLAACVGHPDIEIHEATLVSADGARGVLIRRARVARVKAPGQGIDPALAGLPADETRSLMRRVIEELGDAAMENGGLVPAAIAGGLDLRRDGRAVAALISTAAGLELRSFDPSRSLIITNDAECREAARTLATRPHPVAALTPEEIAEFGRFGSEPPAGGEKQTSAAPADRPGEEAAGARQDSPGERDGADPPAVRILKTGFMEN